MAGRLILAVCLIGLGLVGCDQAGPKDPQMSPDESAALRKDSYTPEQAEARSQRPR